jgi:hypothetical protein
MISISADPARMGAADPRAPGDDPARGEVSVQSVLILPVILGLLWISVHAAMLFHAGNIAAETAAASARAAARSETTASAAVARVAAATAAELGGRLAGEPAIHLGREAVAVSVTVVGPDLVPFLPRTVTRRAVAPVEQFLLEQDR